MDAIILCGGLATRLREVTEDKIPKCLVDINGTPFIKYQLDQCEKWGCEVVVLALGRYAEQVIEYVQTIARQYPFFIMYSLELEALGTGGAIKNGFKKVINTDEVLVMNGDVYNDIDIELLRSKRDSSIQGVHKGSLVMALAEMHNTDRFGVVELDQHGKLVDWKPKQYIESGLINRGIYLITGGSPFNNYPNKFSFEDNFVPIQLEDHTRYIVGCECEGYFIDIGIPEDYRRFVDYISSK